MLCNLSFCFHHVRQRINENREQVGEIIRSAVQQQETSLRGDGHADLFGDCETATSFKALFGKKNLNVTKEFRFIAP